jgi:hypothetical protein
MKIIFKILLCSIFLSLISLLNFQKVYAASSQLTKPAVTIINPIRGSQLGLEQSNILAGLQSQWSVTKEAEIPATWLWQYSAMTDSRLVDFAKSTMKDQEFGIFLEIDRTYAQQAGVVYRGQGPWYFSDGVFLVAYDKAEREKLIDAVFEKFKETFGYYPKSVGAWWVGADSLEYMQRKYGIVASLQVAEQYDLDVYSVWGTPWSMPYVSAKNNAAIPASSYETSSNVVIMQWAPRDPTSGYGNTQEYSTFSMQDYYLKKYDLSYVDYLFSIFLKKPGDQVVMGLEAGLDPESYKQEYRDKLLKVKTLQEQQKLSIQTMGEFASQFLAEKKVFAKDPYFLTKAFASNDQSFWYHSENYRAGIIKKDDTVYLVDLRNYALLPNEDFAVLPNSQGYLRINVPSIIDSARNPSQEKVLGQTQETLTIKKEKEAIILTDGEKQFARFTKDTLEIPNHKYSLTKQQEKDETAFFDKKELLFFPLLQLSPLSLSVNLALLSNVPFFILLSLIGGLAIIKRFDIAFVFLFVFLLLYSHMPDFIVTEFITRKKIIVLSGTAFYLIISLILFFFIYKIRRHEFKKILFVLGAGFLIVISMLLLSWQYYSISPFEKESLEKVSTLRKNVYMLLPNENPTYRAIEPVLFKNYHHAESLTKTQWEAMKRSEGKFLEFEDLKTHIIFVPRYLGAELYPEEIKKYKLKKIFDNAQIAIFSL